LDVNLKLFVLCQHPFSRQTHREGFNQSVHLRDNGAGVIFGCVGTKRACEFALVEWARWVDNLDSLRPYDALDEFLF
jgi:hypothetical protein